MSSESLVLHSLDEYFQSTPIGSLDKAIGNNLYGLNHQQINGQVPSNRDTYGMTFFVRPQLNLQTDNVRNVRQFTPLLSANPLSLQAFVRGMLDPRIGDGYQFNALTVPPRPNPFVDNNNAFISVCTNNLNSVSGWPDLVAPTHTSARGLFNEEYTMIDGLTRNMETFDLDVSFRNTRGDVLLYMFYIWLHYASAVFKGDLVPYMDYITENMIDYNTRIYRLVLDQQKERVVKIGACGAAFPVSVPVGSFLDYNKEKVYSDQNKDITVRFRCMGMDIMDDILVKEFNATVVIFNPSMDDSVREKSMVHVPRILLGSFNNRGYPRINPDNNNLEYWVFPELFHMKTSTVLNKNVSTVNQDLFESGD